jgi:hypothetical protein
VPEDYSGHSSRFRLQIQISDVVQDVEAFACGFGHLDRMQLLCPRLHIHIAAHSHYGSNVSFRQACIAELPEQIS